jgi:hypothetical protein
MENTQINKIRYEKGNIMNAKEIQRVMRDYFENLYSNKLESLEEMDKFLDEPREYQPLKQIYNK